MPISRVARILAVAVLFGMMVTGAGQAEQVLTVFTMPHVGNPTWYAAGAEAFMRAHPDVEVQMVSGWTDKLYTMAAAGEAPDIITYSSSEGSQLVPKNLLSDLGPYLERDSDLTLDKFLPNAVEALKFQGVLYGLPRQWSTVALLYNAQIFDERGVTYPTGAWTWDDLVENGKKLTYGGGDQDTPDVYGFADLWNNHHRIPIWVWGAGGEYWNEDYTQSLLNSAEAERGFAFLIDLYRTWKIAPHPSIEGFSSHTNAFDQGRVAMFYTTRFFRPSNEAFRLGVAPIAQGPKGRTTLAIVDFVGISPTTKHPNLAWELAKYYASEEGFSQGMDLEPRQGYYWGLSPFRDQALEQLLATGDLGDETWLTTLSDSRPAPTFHPSGVRAVPNIDAVYNGEASLRNLLDDTVRTWNAQIAQAIADGATW